MIFSSQLQFSILLDIIDTQYPELFIKLIGANDDLEEFHHTLWTLPFYQKLVVSNEGINTTKYLYLSDRNTSSSNLFFIYELTYSRFSLKCSCNMEKRIIDVKEDYKEFTESLEKIISSKCANHVPNSIWRYTALL